MVLHDYKRRRWENSINEQQCSNTKPSQPFPLLDLPLHLVSDILSRLPLTNIIRCTCVCKIFLKLIKDPYFAKLHLARGPTLTTNLILQETVGRLGALYFFTFDLCESTLSSCSSNDQNVCSYSKCGLPILCRINAEFSFRTERVTLIGSCNGLLCLYFDSGDNPFYGICNPILGECTKLPQPTASAPLYTYAKYSGFGYCSRLKQYKVIRFLHLTSVENPMNSKRIVADLHTLGSDSWRRIEDAPCPKRNSFDPFLNGALHWITNSEKPSELISSFDLEREKFDFVPPPPHFNAAYMRKVSWINIGVLRGNLCICYIYEDAMFEAWVMREYGVKETWRKEFGIDMKFYCKLQVEDLHRPIKFVSNGDLWFVSSSDSLVSFSPEKRTFRELRSMGPWRPGVTAHDLSFVSLNDVFKGGKKLQVKKSRRGRTFVFGI